MSTAIQSAIDALQADLDKLREHDGARRLSAHIANPAVQFADLEALRCVLAKAMDRVFYEIAGEAGLINPNLDRDPSEYHAIVSGSNEQCDLAYDLGRRAEMYRADACAA